MGNDRLRSTLASAGMTSAELGERIQVDPKTVERWIASERLPHRSNRQRVSAALGCDEAYLWPSAFSDSTATAVSKAEVLSVYPNRGSVPISLWQSLFGNAVASIDVLAFADSFLHDTLPDVDEILIAKARAGVKVRLLFGDPDSEAVRIRGVEEGIGESLAQRCRLTWQYLEPLLDAPEVLVRAHASTLYCSIFRFDDDLLANHHVLGAPANHSPVLHFRRLVGGRLFDHHLKSFDHVGATAVAGQPGGQS
jgi:transcriptional regulator with XRE-family HTH domain